LPSEALFSHFDDNLAIEQQWKVDGLNYWRTCEAWLQNLDRNRAEILTRFCQDLDARKAKRNLQRWRIFFMACAELFRYRSGNEWFVAQYLFHQVASNAGKKLTSDAKRQQAPAFRA
jgi:cyclopropane-fatty-acyl-phospholipid synthase